jgi:hypothetical protein
MRPWVQSLVLLDTGTRKKQAPIERPPWPCKLLRPWKHLQLLTASIGPLQGSRLRLKQFVPDKKVILPKSIEQVKWDTTGSVGFWSYSISYFR